MYLDGGLLPVDLGDETLVVAAILLVGHPHRLLGVVRLQGVLLLQVERHKEERGRIWKSTFLFSNYVPLRAKLIFFFFVPGSGSLEPPALTWPGMAVFQSLNSEMISYTNIFKKNEAIKYLNGF